MKLLPTVFALLCLVTPLTAQSGDIVGLRERLAGENDIPTLRRREFTLNRATSTSPEALLERGMVLMRIYQLTRDDEDIKNARKMFERATKKLPDDPRTYYAMGLARIGGPGVRVPSPGGVLNSIVLGQSLAEIAKRDPVSLAKIDFKKALELNPDFASAGVELARLSLDTRDKKNMEEAAIALRRIVGDGHGGTETATALSEIEEALGNVVAAAKAAETATGLVSVGGGPGAAASAAHARAVALLRQPDKRDAGAAAYFEGVEQLTDESAAAYFDAVEPIVTDHEMAEWHAADLGHKKEWLRRFWNVRAAGSGVTIGERMAEHFNRLAVAHDKYRRTSKRGAAPGGSLLQQKYKDDMLPFDDRGLIYVRHGKPEQVVRTSDVDLRPNESWVYNDNGKTLLYNFVVLRDGTDYRIVDDVLLALDPSTRGMPVDAAVKLLRDRQAYEPRYAALASKFDSYDRSQRNAGFLADAGQSASAGMNESTQSINTASTRIAADMRAQALVALSSDSDTPDFKGDLPFYYDLYAFRGHDGMIDVTAAAAVPGASLFSQPMGNQYVYAIQASLIFIDTVTNDIARKDTVYTFRSNRVLGAKEHLRVTVEMTLPFLKAGVHRIVLRDLVNPGVGQLYGGPSDLKNFAGRGLMLSDIVLAAPEEGPWARGNARLGLVPPRQFEEKKPLKLFYELYNLPAGASYRTEISMAPVEGITGFGRIKKLFGGNDGKVQIQFDGVGPAQTNGTIQELREVSTEMKPGRYKVVVRVTSLEDQQSVRSETLLLISQKPKK